MQVKVKLFSRLRELLPLEAGGEAIVELPDGATVDHLLHRMGIDGHIKLLSINSQRETDWERVLHEGDMVRVFPIVVGG
jgi:molybdopterin converting factor small subunit